MIMGQQFFRTRLLNSALGLTLLFSATLQSLGQQRGGQGGGFGGGGFGGGGGGFGGGGGGGARGGATAGTTRQYSPAGTVGSAIITVDPESRQIIVITDDETSTFVSQVITNLDRPKPQVLIKVVFLEVTYNNASDIGVEGGFRKDINNSTSANGANVFGLGGLNSIATNLSMNSLGQPIQSFQPTPPGASLYQVLGQDYQVTLRAIAQAGKTEVLSRPSILTRNNQPATITVGQSIPLVTSVSFNGLTGTPINSISYTSVGIILKVTPFINSDNLVEMIVSPQISQLSDQSVAISAGANAPVIDVRSADTVVVTPNGQTVIIGGLMRTQKTQTDSKVPLLGDIPGLGNLFKRKVKASTKTELLIFLTPHIVRQPMDLAALSASEKGAIELAPKAFTQEELDKFIDGLPRKETTSPSEPKAKKKSK